MKRYAITVQQYKYGVTYRVRTETEVKKHYLNSGNGEKVMHWVVVAYLSKDEVTEVLKRELEKAAGTV